MDAYTLMAKMRKARRMYAISAGAQGLFGELIAINNEERWVSVFKCRNAELLGALTISEKTLAVYRNELIAAGLLTFKSGKSKREPSDYSLNGGSIGVRNGGSIGSNIYHQSEHQSGEKTPDLIKHNTEEINKNKNLLAEEDESALARKNEIDTAMAEYFAEPDKNSNVAFREPAFIPEKEKNCEKKEKKPLPTVDEAIAAVSALAYWRHVLEHHKQSEAEREDLFKIFYEQREDFYNVRLPTWRDVAQHFYNWVPIHLSKDHLKKLNGNAINRSKSIAGRDTKPSGSADRAAKINGVENLMSKSEEFLQRHHPDEY